MSYPFNEVQGRRVRCPGCHKADECRRAEGEIHDSSEFSSFYCSFCQSIFPVCNYCGESSTSGDFCYYCNQTHREKGWKKKLDSSRLPEGTVASEYTRDPSGRPGHWIHEPTGRVFDFSPDWSNV